MKTEALRQALDEGGWDAAFGGARRDEEKSRAKERIFSHRSAAHAWDPRNQRPELWRLFNTRIREGESMRVFPLSNWTELDVWEYVEAENIPVVPLYFSKARPVVERSGALIMVDDERLPLEPGEAPRDGSRPIPHARLLSADRRHSIRSRDARRHHRRNARLDDLRAAGPPDRHATKPARWRRRSGRAISDERGAQTSALPTLRLLTCGSVDDGKSTLIGRLLYEKKLIFDDQLSALERNSKKFGTTEDDIDFALLVDGLEAEREQGITIDVAYRYFATEKRSFIVADTPGHEQYTRNMATGASNADLAIVLVDARKGLLTQTHRHSIIASLLGVRHIVLAVNKIDLVGLRREDLSRHRRRLSASSPSRSASAPSFAIPLSARYGDNVSSRSAAHALVRGRASPRHARAGRGRGGPPRGALPPSGPVDQPSASRLPRRRRHDRQRADRKGRRDRRRRLRPPDDRDGDPCPPTRKSTAPRPATPSR